MMPMERSWPLGHEPHSRFPWTKSAKHNTLLVRVIRSRCQMEFRFVESRVADRNRIWSRLFTSAVALSARRRIVASKSRLASWHLSGCYQGSFIL